MNRTISATGLSIAMTALSCMLIAASAQTRTHTANGSLKGAFALYGTEQCLHASAFGPPPVLEAVGPTHTENVTIQGTIEFDGAGKGELTARAASLMTNPLAAPPQQSTLRCSIAYSLDAEGGLRVERACKGTITRGSRSVGAQVWSTSPVQLSGTFHRVTGTMYLADTELAVETITSFRGSRTPRLCHRTWTAARMQKPS